MKSFINIILFCLLLNVIGEPLRGYRYYEAAPNSYASHSEMSNPNSFFKSYSSGWSSSTVRDRNGNVIYHSSPATDGAPKRFYQNTICPEHEFSKFFTPSFFGYYPSFYPYSVAPFEYPFYPMYYPMTYSWSPYFYPALSALSFSPYFSSLFSGYPFYI